MKPQHLQVITRDAAISLDTLAHHPLCPSWIAAHLSATATELRSAAQNDRAATIPPDHGDPEGFCLACIGEVS